VTFVDPPEEPTARPPETVEQWKNIAFGYWERIADLENAIGAYQDRVTELKDDIAELLHALDRYSTIDTFNMTLGEVKEELRRRAKAETTQDIDDGLDDEP